MTNPFRLLMGQPSQGEPERDQIYSDVSLISSQRIGYKSLADWKYKHVRCWPWCCNFQMGTKICHCIPCERIYITARFLVLISVIYLFLVGCVGQLAYPPDQPYFILFCLFSSAYVVGWSGGTYLYLPPLVGMMTTGIIFANTGVYDLVTKQLSPGPLVLIRVFAVSFVLVRSGLSLEIPHIHRHRYLLLTIAFIPSLIEICTTAVIAHFVLNDFPWVWCFVLGSVIGCTSPSHVLHLILNLAERGYVTKSNLYTIVIAASLLDLHNSIVLFSIFMNIIISPDPTNWRGYALVIAEIAGGVIVGILFGFLLAVIPNSHDKHVGIFRTVLLQGAATGTMFFLRTTQWSAASILAIAFASVIAGRQWVSEGWNTHTNPVIYAIAMGWTVLHLALYSLMGTDIVVSEIIEDYNLWYIVLMIFCIAIVRAVSTFAVASIFPGIDVKERVFLALALIPKATIQAALGPMALEMVAETSDKDYGAIVVRVSAMCVIITAPLGAYAMRLLGPKLLTLNEEEVIPPEDRLYRHGGEQPHVYAEDRQTLTSGQSRHA